MSTATTGYAPAALANATASWPNTPSPTTAQFSPISNLTFLTAAIENVPINDKAASSGEIPSGTKLKIYVGDKYSNGDIVNVYSYDKQNNKLTLVKNNISVKDGYLEFDVDKNAEYFITKADLSRLNQNVASSFNIFAIISIIELIVIIILIFLVKK